MEEQRFEFKWERFPGRVVSLLDKLRQDEQMVDVTLSCKDYTTHVHKVVLSACSPYFQQLLTKTAHQQTLVVLKDTSADDLRSIVHFMYAGEVNVPQSQLASFMKTAEVLEIEGLCSSSRQQKQADAAAVQNITSHTTGTIRPTLNLASLQSHFDSAERSPSVVRLNIGGGIFTSSRHTLSKFGPSFFTDLLQNESSAIRDDTGAIFIDRDPAGFSHILNYLREEGLDLSGIDIQQLHSNAQFYRIANLINAIDGVLPGGSTAQTVTESNLHTQQLSMDASPSGLQASGSGTHEANCSASDVVNAPKRKKKYSNIPQSRIRRRKPAKYVEVTPSMLPARGQAPEIHISQLGLSLGLQTRIAQNGPLSKMDRCEIIHKVYDLYRVTTMRKYISASLLTSYATSIVMQVPNLHPELDFDERVKQIQVALRNKFRNTRRPKPYSRSENDESAHEEHTESPSANRAQGPANDAGLLAALGFMREQETGSSSAGIRRDPIQELESSCVQIKTETFVDHNEELICEGAQIYDEEPLTTNQNVMYKE